MKSLKQKIFKIFMIVIISILCVAAALNLYIIIQSKVDPNKVPSVFGYKPFIVLSGSMETEIYKGDLVVVKEVNPETLKEKDIIAFREDGKHVVTHRIVEIINENGEVKLITKGDNNNKKDDGSVSFSQIEGKYLFKICGLGNLILTMQKPLTLITILGLIVIFGVLWIVIGNNKMTKEEKKELEELRKEKKKAKEKE